MCRRPGASRASAVVGVLTRPRSPWLLLAGGTGLANGLLMVLFVGHDWPKVWSALAVGELVALAVAYGFVGYAAYESEAALFLHLTPAPPSRIVRRLIELLRPYLEGTFIAILGLAAGAVFGGLIRPYHWFPAVSPLGGLAVVLAGALWATVVLWATAFFLVIAGGRTIWRWCASWVRLSQPFHLVLLAFLPALVTGVAVWVTMLPPLLPAPLAQLVLLVLPVHWPVSAVMALLTEGGATPRPSGLAMVSILALASLAAVGLGRRRLAEGPSEEDRRAGHLNTRRRGPRPLPSADLAASLVTARQRLVARIDGEDPRRFMSYVPVCLAWVVLALVLMGGLLLVQGPARPIFTGNVLRGSFLSAILLVVVLSSLPESLASQSLARMLACAPLVRLRRPRWRPAWAVYPISVWEYMRLKTTYSVVKWLLMGLPVCITVILGCRLAGFLTGASLNQTLIAAMGMVWLSILLFVAIGFSQVTLARWRAAPMSRFGRPGLVWLILSVASVATVQAALMAMKPSPDVENLLLLHVVLLASSVTFAVARRIDRWQGLDISDWSIGEPGT